VSRWFDLNGVRRLAGAGPNNYHGHLAATVATPPVERGGLD